MGPGIPSIDSSIYQNIYINNQESYGIEDSAIEQVSLPNNTIESNLENSSITTANNQTSITISNSADRPILPLPDKTLVISSSARELSSSFFSPSILTAIFENMAELMKMQSRQKTTITEFDIVAKQWCLELALRSSNEIKNHAQLEAILHYALAGNSGTRLGISAPKAAIGIRFLLDSYREYNKEKAKLKNIAQQAESLRPSSNITEAEMDAHAKADLAKQTYENFSDNKEKIVGEIFDKKMVHIKTLDDTAKQTVNSTESILQNLLKVEDARYEATMEIYQKLQSSAGKIPDSLREMLSGIQEDIDQQFSYLNQLIASINKSMYISRH